jgi:hypothetical protein
MSRGGRGEPEGGRHSTGYIDSGSMGHGCFLRV